MSDVQYLYNGVLTKEVTDWVRGLLQDYPYAMEVSGMIPLDQFDLLFANRSWTSTGEDCMGQPTSHTRTGVPWAWVNKSRTDMAGFLFLKDSDTHKQVADRFPELVVNGQPFQTQFG